jgi:cysteine synthase
MPKWFENNSHAIGRTPLLRLNRVVDHAPATVLAKLLFDAKFLCDAKGLAA